MTISLGRHLKVGLIEDKDNKDAIMKLATFSSSTAGEAGTN